MKKLIIPIISAIVLLSILAIAIFALNSQKNAEIVKPSTFETLSSVITAEDGAYSIAKFNQKEIFADLSRDNLRQIFAAFDVVLAKNDTIEIKDTMYHRSLFYKNGIKYTLNNDIDLEYMYVIDGEEDRVLNHDGKMTIDTNQDSDCLKYAMLSSVYMELFPDNWTYGETAEQIALSNVWSPMVIVIPDYKEYGFDSAFEAYQSFNGRTQDQFIFSEYFEVVGTKEKEIMSEIMKNTEDPYVLEYFFHTLDQAKLGYENYPMAKKEGAVK